MAIQITSPSQLAELARQLRSPDGGGIAREIRDALRSTARPVAADARAAIRGLRITGDKTRGGRRPSRPSRARRGPPLRASIAAAIVCRDLPHGVSIEVDENLLPPALRVMPALLERTEGWWHPVYGNRAVWAHERGGPWFGPTTDRHVPRFEAAAHNAADRAAVKLAQEVRSA